MNNQDMSAEDIEELTKSYERDLRNLLDTLGKRKRTTKDVTIRLFMSGAEQGGYSHRAPFDLGLSLGQPLDNK